MKRTIAKFIWKLCGISPRMGNFIMDVIGEHNYLKVMALANDKYCEFYDL